jgi:5-methyltetrahydropteroyltriglutamate--homocysteine methyltransferase
VQTSCSLQHVPLDTARESNLAPALKGRLAFAVQKLSELRALATNKSSAANGNSSSNGAAAGGGGTGMQVDKGMFDRPAGAEERRAAQFKANPNV